MKMPFTIFCLSLSSLTYATVCSDDALKRVESSHFELKSEEAKKDLKCLTYDFDGDKETDQLIFQERASSDPTTSPHFVARFYSGKGNRTIAIDRNFGSPPRLYNPVDWKKYGCPKKAGFFDPGEGGSNHVYIWNSKKKTFDHSTCASESS